MPEMPEVETVRRGLMNIAAGRKIQGIDVYYGKTVENAGSFRTSIKLARCYKTISVYTIHKK